MNMNMIKLFWYFLGERHQIYLNRKDGKPWPWTEDKILKTYKFTNVFRQLDRVTTELTKQVIQSPKAKKRLDLLVFNIIKFRMFNWPDTYEALGGFRSSWNEKKAIKKLKKLRKAGHKIFTGAYMQTNGGSHRDKITMTCKAITEFYRQRKKLANIIRESRTVEHWVYQLQKFPLVGPFVAYELATDIRHLADIGVLVEPYDIMTWANPGPGARRGLNRIYGRPLKNRTPVKKMISEMVEILELSRTERPTWLPALELRDIEHSLCEFDKYMRVKRGQGKPRSRYLPPAQGEPI